MHHAPQPVNYIAEIRDAQEATLVGTANLDFWQTHLTAQRLHPVIRDGRAEVVVSAVALKWLGLRFNELSISIGVADEPNRVTRSGFYLVAAFNTSRLLAWCERTFFRTPYLQGQVEVQVNPRCGFKLLERTNAALRAQRCAQSPAVSAPDEVWEVPIHLPSGPPGEFIQARLSGVTEVYPFDPEMDTVELKPSARHPVMKQLVDTQFSGVEWRVRPHAQHARSKTFTRNP